MNKGSLRPLYSPAHVPPSLSQSHYCSISLVVPLALLSRKPHFLGSCRFPSINVNTFIPEDIPRGRCFQVSSTSLMSSLNHLIGVISAFWDGCVSCAQLQLLHWTIEICKAYWFVHYLVEDPGFHLTLAHWWVYYGTHIVSCPLWFLGCVGDSVRKPQCHASMYL